MGDKLFDALTQDLARGFSQTNLKSMRIFAEHYPTREFGQAMPAQLAWMHHIKSGLFKRQSEISPKFTNNRT